MFAVKLVVRFSTKIAPRTPVMGFPAHELTEQARIHQCLAAAVLLKLFGQLPHDGQHIV